MQSKSGENQCAHAVVHDDSNHVPRRQQTFQNRTLVQSKTNIATQSSIAVPLIANWTVRLLIGLSDC